jgi:hypothetical protein
LKDELAHPALGEKFGMTAVEVMDIMDKLRWVELMSLFLDWVEINCCL